MPTVRFTRRRLLLAAFILLPALALRALVPVGFMPGQHAGFGVAMELCTSQGLQTIIVYPDGGGDPAPAGKHVDAPCAYALGAVVGPAPLLPGVALAHAPALPPAHAVVRTVAAATCPRAQSPRGPPALV